jgi:hypothetical protein
MSKDSFAGKLLAKYNKADVSDVKAFRNVKVIPDFNADPIDFKVKKKLIKQDYFSRESKPLKLQSEQRMFVTDFREIKKPKIEVAPQFQIKKKSNLAEFDALQRKAQASRFADSQVTSFEQIQKQLDVEVGEGRQRSMLQLEGPKQRQMSAYADVKVGEKKIGKYVSGFAMPKFRTQQMQKMSSGLSSAYKPKVAVSQSMKQVAVTMPKYKSTQFKVRQTQLTKLGTSSVSAKATAVAFAYPTITQLTGQFNSTTRNIQTLPVVGKKMGSFGGGFSQNWKGFKRTKAKTEDKYLKNLFERLFARKNGNK